MSRTRHGENMNQPQGFCSCHSAIQFKAIFYLFYFIFSSKHPTVCTQQHSFFPTFTLQLTLYAAVPLDFFFHCHLRLRKYTYVFPVSYRSNTYSQCKQSASASSPKLSVQYNTTQYNILCIFSLPVKSVLL